MTYVISRMKFARSTVGESRSAIFNDSYMASNGGIGIGKIGDSVAGPAN
jgi:hypothetical protein